jgi:hypothetical protein
MAEPTPTDVKPWYLRNITEALALDESSGNVYLRTGFQGNIIISGNVNIPGEVTVVSNEANPLYTHTHIYTPDDEEVSNTNPFFVSVTSGNVTVDGNVGITGNVNIGTMPNVNANITGGNVTVTQGTDPWIVSGNINIDNIPEVEIKNDIDNPIPVSKDTNVNSQTNPIYVEGVNNASFFAPTQSDAFGRLRVSNPLTLFDTQARYFDHQLFSSETSGGGSVTYNSDSSTFTLTVPNGGSVFRETLKTFVYQPGKSLLVLNSFKMNTPTANLQQRVGYFGEDNGIFFEADGTTLNMVIRSSSSGSLVENRIAQSNWNGDKLDGTGTSGITLNPALVQIFWTDVEWLGVGSVRVGFVINGQFIVCHTFNHANQSGNTTTYMTTACLPIRYEITSTGAIGTMLQICSTVISEGGYSLSGLPKAASHNLASPVRLANGADTYTPLISIRLKSTNLDAIVLPINYTISAVASSNYKYRIYKKAITSGGTWVSAGTNSSVEYNLAPTAVVSGDINEESFIISSNQSSQAPSQVEFAFEEQLQRDSFTGTAYEYLITATTTGNNQDLYASIEWQEIS